VRASSVWRARLRLPLLALFALNGLVFVAWTLPRAAAARNLEQDRARLGAELRRERARVAQLSARGRAIQENERDLRRFYEEVVADRSGAVAMLRELDSEAPSSGARGFKPEAVPSTPLERFVVTMPLAGSYADVLGFLGKVETSERFLTVDSLSLREGQGHTDLDVVLSVYFDPRRDAAGSQQAGAAGPAGSRP
jgi:Tfp pilus assembly protein PilO